MKYKSPSIASIPLSFPSHIFTAKFTYVKEQSTFSAQSPVNFLLTSHALVQHSAQRQNGSPTILQQKQEASLRLTNVPVSPIDSLLSERTLIGIRRASPSKNFGQQRNPEDFLLVRHATPTEVFGNTSRGLTAVQTRHEVQIPGSWPEDD